MLRLLRSIFGVGAKQEKYPEKMVRETIERVAEKTDPWLKAALDYNYKLRPVVLLSLDHVVELVKNLPPRSQWNSALMDHALCLLPFLPPKLRC